MAPLLRSPFVRLVLRAGSLSFARSSALALFLLAARMAWTREGTYGFLIWNLVLAWVPFGLSLALRSLHARRAHAVTLAAVFVVWLAFLPNAPYLVTDFIHLRYANGAPLWFDAAMLASYAWAGVGLGVASLRHCADLVRVRRGRWTAAAFVVSASLATGFGIYLGRFLRLNSWDVATQPLTVLAQVGAPLVHPLSHPRAWTVTLIFALFFLATYGGLLARETSSSES